MPSCRSRNSQEPSGLRCIQLFSALRLYLAYCASIVKIARHVCPASPALFASIQAQTPQPKQPPSNKPAQLEHADADNKKGGNSTSAIVRAADAPRAQQANTGSPEEQQKPFPVEIKKQPKPTDTPLFPWYLASTIAGVFANVAILLAILRQNKLNRGMLKTAVTTAKATIRSARAAKRSADAALRGIKLQETQLRQWIAIDNTTIGIGTHKLDSNATEVRLGISTFILNPTGMPITLEWAVLRIDSQRHDLVLNDHVLGPSDSYPLRTFILLRDARLALYREYKLFLNLVLTVRFTDAFGTSRKQAFASQYRCGPPSGANESAYRGRVPDDEIQLQAGEQEQQ